MSGPRFCQRFNIIEGFPCVDLQTAANNGDWVSFKQYNHIAIVFVSGVGTAGDDPTLTVVQATSAAGAGGKALNFTDIMIKQAATSLAGTGSFTHTTQAAANTYTSATAAEQSLIWVVEFDASDLDSDNGFIFLRATVADVGGNAQPGYLFYVGCEPHNAEDLLDSALV